jgi:hypothetical protein
VSGESATTSNNTTQQQDRKNQNNMNAEIVRELNMLIRVDGYMADHPLVPAIPLATTQITRIQLSITELNGLGGNQDGGAALRSGSAADRRRIAKELRKALSRIARVGKQLDQELYPGTAQQFRCVLTRTRN